MSISFGIEKLGKNTTNIKFKTSRIESRGSLNEIMTKNCFNLYNFFIRSISETIVLTNLFELFHSSRFSVYSEIKNEFY
jgi:hypothetical protein